MKTRFIDLFKNKVKPEKVFNRYNLDKKDRRDLSKIVNNYNNTNGGNTEDNLSKVERAFIINGNLYVQDNQYRNDFIATNINKFSSIIDVSSDSNMYVYGTSEKMIRPNFILGFAVNCNVIDLDNEFFERCKEHFIEVPVAEYYNLGNNKRVYNLDKIANYKETAQKIVEILDTFEYNSDSATFFEGYLIPIPATMDDWGFILRARKEENDNGVLDYYVSAIHNGQYTEFYLKEIYG